MRLALLAAGSLLQDAHDLLFAEWALFQDRLLAAQVGAESNLSFVSVYGEQTNRTSHHRHTERLGAAPQVIDVCH